MTHSFEVYIDESLDEGFKFDGQNESSTWFVLSALVIKKENDLKLVELTRECRELLGKPDKHDLHFRKLKHEQKVAYLKQIPSVPIRTITVACNKRELNEPEYLQQGYNLYYYCVRYLLERVSWLCREHQRNVEGNGQARIIFSNRSAMSYDEIKDYLKRLREKESIQIDWSVIDEENIIAIPHRLRAGFQLVDAVAGAYAAMLEKNHYGDIETRYVKEILRVAYRNNGSLFG
ncbi:MAG: DUF3800 domain-containing protein [Planctomycetaceae bacterium]|nr:DUF3800 domain-containing protein [Planctomycetaceae bacterium]